MISELLRCLLATTSSNRCQESWAVRLTAALLRAYWFSQKLSPGALKARTYFAFPLYDRHSFLWSDRAAVSLISTYLANLISPH